MRETHYWSEPRVYKYKDQWVVSWYCETCGHTTIDRLIPGASILNGYARLALEIVG